MAWVTDSCRLPVANATASQRIACRPEHRGQGHLTPIRQQSVISMMRRILIAFVIVAWTSETQARSVANSPIFSAWEDSCPETTSLLQDAIDAASSVSGYARIPCGFHATGPLILHSGAKISSAHCTFNQSEPTGASLLATGMVLGVCRSMPHSMLYASQRALCLTACSTPHSVIYASQRTLCLTACSLPHSVSMPYRYDGP